MPSTESPVELCAPEAAAPAMLSAVGVARSGDATASGPLLSAAAQVAVECARAPEGAKSCLMCVGPSALQAAKVAH